MCLQIHLVSQHDTTSSPLLATFRSIFARNMLLLTVLCLVLLQLSIGDDTNQTGILIHTAIGT